MLGYFALMVKILNWAPIELVGSKGTYFLIPKNTHGALGKEPTPRMVKDRYLAIFALTGLQVSLDGGDGTKPPEKFAHTVELKAAHVLLLKKNHRYYIPMQTGYSAFKWFELELDDEREEKC